MKTQPKVDVVTVGAGWTAAIYAWKLTKAGYRVVSLEQGPERWTYPDFAHNHDSIRYSVRKAMMYPLGMETWSWRPNASAPSLPIRRYGAFHPGQGVGGAAVHWSAQLYRFHPDDFRLRSHYVEKYGEDIIPEGMTIKDWGIEYDELEPYFTQFEIDIGASGETSNLDGELLDGGVPMDPPRSEPYPLPPLERNIPSMMFAEASEALGYHPHPQPAGILSEAYVDPFGNERSGCLYCGFCTRFGCEVDAKTSPQTTHIPLALETGRYEIRTQSHVLRVLTGPDGLATGVEYIDSYGELCFQPADVVVLSGYTMTNVKLLMVSTSEQHPDGIGNSEGMLGKNLTHQVWQNPVTGIFEGRRFNLYMGNTSTQTSLLDFYNDYFDHSELDFIDGATFFSTIGEREPVTSVGSVPVINAMRQSGGEGVMTGGLVWGQELKEAVRNSWDSFVPITIEGAFTAHENNFMDLDPVYKDAYGMPLLRLTLDFQDNERNLYRFMAQRTREIMEEMGPTHMDFTEELGDYNVYDYQSTHINGGAIMGADPGDSVTNNHGQVWDAPNIFVTGAALYPQNPGANPTNTLCALAYRTGDALVERYFDNPNDLLGT